MLFYNPFREPTLPVGSRYRHSPAQSICDTLPTHSNPQYQSQQNPHSALANPHLVTFLGANATAWTPGKCAPGTYRCDPTLTTIEMCAMYGWILVLLFRSNTWIINAVDGVSYCHDA